MRRKPAASTSSTSKTKPSPNRERPKSSTIKVRRSGSVWLMLVALIVYSIYSIHHYQFQNLPHPLTSGQAGKRGFSEVEAFKHVRHLTSFGPHPIASDALDHAFQYVLEEVDKIKATAHWEVDVEIDVFHVESGANRMVGGLFAGKTLVYADLNHIVLRILSKYSEEAADNAILVSSHIDTVFSSEGAGDCSSCVGVMLELARGLSQWAHGFKNSIIFLFNTGEEEGLSGAHSFITQHPWNTTIRMAIDLEAMGIGGKSLIFQAGPHPWAIENFASVAKYPTGHIIAQDLFSSGVIKSATDFQVYKEVAGLSGLDFAYTDNSAVYHTKNDKLKLLNPGSLQHLGENMLAFLLHSASSPHLPKDIAKGKEENGSYDSAIYFDILGMYMIIYSQRFASQIYSAVIMQSLMILSTSVYMGGQSAVISFGLSCLSLILMWLFAISSSVLVAFLLPLVSSLPVPYTANPWLVVGLFAAPAFVGAITGQHFGYVILKRYLSNFYKKNQVPLEIQADLVKLEAERWLYKAGFVQWLALLIVGNHFKFGSTYIALFWLVPPAVAYGLLEATLSPLRLPSPLKLVTLLMGMALPFIISSGVVIRLVGTVIGMMARFDRNPGSPEWMGNIMVSGFIAAIICLTLVYILSYIHLSDAKRLIILATTALFGLSLILVVSNIVPPFTEDAARAVNVVHIVDNTAHYGDKLDPTSYVSLFSVTPGELSKEAEQIRGGFTCGRNKTLDLVSFSVKYGCLSYDDTRGGWSKSDIPTLHVDGDSNENERMTHVSIDTKASVRWVLAINTDEIKDFILKGNSEELVPLGGKNGTDGWHLIQFSGGKNSPTKFELTLFWLKSSNSQVGEKDGKNPLLKLRTDVNRITPKAKRVLSKLPSWCSLFGKSTSPYTLAFLTSLPINFSS